MKTSVQRFQALLALTLFAGLAPAQQYVPNEVLIQLRPGLARSAAPLLIGSHEVEKVYGSETRRYRLSPGLSVERAVEHYRRLPYVQFAEPNYTVQAFETPNDPQFDNQVYMHKIRCDAGWDFTMGSSAVIIAVVDTGVDLAHPDLVGKLVTGFDFHNGDNNPNDDNGHGTHVAGVAAAATDNGLGIAGVGWNCLIMPVKALGSSGTGQVSNVAAAINYAVNNGAKVVSLSLGTRNNSSVLNNAVLNAKNLNVTVVAAAGNSGTNVQHYPAAYADVIAVGATTLKDAKTNFSNFGFWVDVAAPGEDVFSLWKGGGFKVMSGTSMATPQVSGLAALLWSHLGKGFPAADIRARIEENSHPVGTWLEKGRIDVERAMLNLGPPTEIRRTAVPTDFEMQHGQVVSGGLAEILSSDNAWLDINAIRTAGQRKVSLFASVFPEWSGQKIKLELNVEVSSAPTGMVNICLWNWDELAWDLCRSRSVGLADRVLNVSTFAPETYVGPDGEVLVQITRTDSRNRPFRVRVDKIEVVSVSAE